MLIPRPASLALALTVLALATACQAIRPYEKEYLLHPLMDDASVQRLKSPLMSAAASRFERLAAGAGTSTEGKSCPTCGG